MSMLENNEKKREQTKNSLNPSQRSLVITIALQVESLINIL